MMKSITLCYNNIHSNAECSCRLNRLLGDVVISQGGVVPHIAAVRPYIYFPLDYLPLHIHSGTPAQQIKQVQERCRRCLIFFYIILIHFPLYFHCVLSISVVCPNLPTFVL
jgi:hypothetical protein